MARRKKAEPAPEPIDRRFEGSAYSNEELKFLIQHLGEAPIVALGEDADVPDHVNEAAVEPILRRVHELNLYQDSLNTKYGPDTPLVWCGIPALKKVCQETLVWREQVQELKKRTKGAPSKLRAAAGAPSLYFWDPDTDVPYLGGTGADAERTLHALGDNGARNPLYVELRKTGLGAIQSLAGVARFIKSKTPQEEQSRLTEVTPQELLFAGNENYASVACPICGHAEEYETKKESTKQAAMRRMTVHLRTAKINKDQHDLLLKRVQSGRSGHMARQQQAEDAEEVTA